MVLVSAGHVGGTRGSASHLDVYNTLFIIINNL